MAWLHGDSFDFTTTTAQLLLGNWTAQAFNPTMLSGANTRFSSGNCVLFSNGMQLDKGNLANTAEAICAFSLYFDSVSGFSGTSTQGLFLQFMDGSTVQCWVQFGADGNIYVKNASFANIATWTSPNGWTANSWHHWQIKVKIDNAAGAVTIRHNGSSTDSFTATGLDTQNTANAYFNKFSFSQSQLATRVDDFLLFDTGGPAPNTWVGDVRAVQLMPNADTATKDFSRSTGVDNYALVDETSPNSDTDYVQTDVAGNKDLYDLQNLASTPTSIVCVQAKMFVEKTDAGYRESGIYHNSGGTTGTSAVLVVGMLYQWQLDPMVLNPNGSVAWTGAAVNALQIGPKLVT